MQKLLEEIVAVLPEVQVVGDCDKIIKDITADSREVREGSLFICLKGAHVDGHKYLEQAAASGAGAALVEDVPEVCPDGLTLLRWLIPDWEWKLSLPFSMIIQVKLCG